VALAFVALGLASSGCENTEPGIGVFGNPEKLVVVVIPCADDTLIHAVELRSITAQKVRMANRERCRLNRATIPRR
jgi:hypothetical protein